MAAPSPDLCNVDKLSDMEVEELYFDTQDVLLDAARKLWDAPGRLNRDTGYRRVADIIAPTPGLPPWRQVITWKKLLTSLQESTREFQSEIQNMCISSQKFRICAFFHHIRQHIRESLLSPLSHMPVQEPCLQSFETVQHNHRSQAATSIRPEQTFQRFTEGQFGHDRF